MLLKALMFLFPQERGSVKTYLMGLGKVLLQVRGVAEKETGDEPDGDRGRATGREQT